MFLPEHDFSELWPKFHLCIIWTCSLQSWHSIWKNMFRHGHVMRCHKSSQPLKGGFTFHIATLFSPEVSGNADEFEFGSPSWRRSWCSPKAFLRICLLTGSWNIPWTRSKGPWVANSQEPEKQGKPPLVQENDRAPQKHVKIIPQLRIWVRFVETARQGKFRHTQSAVRNPQPRTFKKR